MCFIYLDVKKYEAFSTCLAAIFRVFEKFYQHPDSCFLFPSDSETLTLFGISRFFCHFLLLFSVHLTSISMFRFLAAVFQTVVVSMTAGSFAILFVLLFSGFIIPQRKTSYFLNLIK